MQTRTLGRNGPEVSALGLGCMGMSTAYGKGDDAESVRLIQHALDCGVNFLDTADIYGPHTNEVLVGKAITGRRDAVFLATKFGFVPDPADPVKRTLCGRPDYVRSACDASLARLGTDYIDLYYQHRIDRSVPIEDTVGAMADLVTAGKIRHVGLSEPSVATLERACKVHPVTAVQSEYSLWTRDPEDGVLAACERLGVGFVPFSPLGRGFLTGALKSADAFGAHDYRRTSPRFEGENFRMNLALVDKVRELAAAKGCTPAQLALAWVLVQGEHIVPIPGTKHRKYFDENLAALDVRLDAADLAAIDAVFPRDVAAGARYRPAGLAMLRG
ncbi:MAG TPA: aldo/keto reductase [Rhodanobacteraceae bacterium]